MTMTPKEVILKAFACEKADRIPVTLFGAGMWSIKDYGTSFEALALDPQKMADMCVAEAARIRSDVVYVGSGYNNFHASALGKAFGVGIKYREMGAPDMTTHFVNTEEDLAKLDIADVHRDPVVQTVLEATRLVKAKIGDTYLVTMTCWGPFTLAARMVGEETFMKAIFKKPAFVEKMVDFCADLLIHVYEPLVQDGLECLSIADPTASGDLINKKQMERFAVPGLQKLTGWAKEQGRPLDPAHLRRHQRPARSLPRHRGEHHLLRSEGGHGQGQGGPGREDELRRQRRARARAAQPGRRRRREGLPRGHRDRGGDARVHPGAGVRHPADDSLREPQEIPRRGAGVETLSSSVKTRNGQAARQGLADFSAA